MRRAEDNHKVSEIAWLGWELVKNRSCSSWAGCMFAEHYHTNHLTTCTIFSNVWCASSLLANYQRRLDKYQLLTHHDSMWPYLYGLACVDVQWCGNRDLNVGCYSKFIDLCSIISLVKQPEWQLNLLKTNQKGVWNANFIAGPSVGFTSRFRMGRMACGNVGEARILGAKHPRCEVMGTSTV